MTKAFIERVESAQAVLIDGQDYQKFFWSDGSITQLDEDGLDALSHDEINLIHDWL